MEQDNLIAICPTDRLPERYPNIGKSDDILFMPHKFDKAYKGFTRKIGHNRDILIFQDYNNNVWHVSEIHRWYELP
ncbi:hypothetical protein LCGC14_0342200 [marine sediment metagenome]|uniref:Uncharacterized protein n=1 Tax=marine sediment metagenome TaxID=412755 RepID=A0A0F9WL05_9ZZZZ